MSWLENKGSKINDELQYTLLKMLWERWFGNMYDKKNKKIKYGFDDSDFEEEIRKIRKLGKKIKEENIKIPDVPKFLLKSKKKRLK